jgi:hypothetical protein
MQVKDLPAWLRAANTPDGGFRDGVIDQPWDLRLRGL